VLHLLLHQPSVLHLLLHQRLVAPLVAPL